MKKILYLIAALALAVMIFTVSASAYEADTEPTEDAEALGADADTDTSLNTDAEGSENIFADIYNYIKENSASVLSALSFISALSVIINNKKGLLPELKNEFSKLMTKSEKYERDGSERCEELKVACENIGKQSEELAEAVRSTDEITKRIAESLSDIAGSATLADGLKRALLAEFEMLYEVFMAASLPQYEKDRIGERFAGVRALLDGGSEEDA